jgi:hypothetical protein
MRQTVLIPSEAAGAAAVYLSWVAYPGDSEKQADRRERFAEATGAVLFKGIGKHPPPFLRGQKKDVAWSTMVAGLQHLHRRRSLAVRLMVRQLQPRERGGLTAMEAYREMAGEVPASFGYGNYECSEGENVEKAIQRLCWRESLPALAMAAPVVHLVKKHGISWQELLHREDLSDWPERAVMQANAIAPLIENAFTPKRLLVPEWTDAEVLKSPVWLPHEPLQIALECATGLEPDEKGP